MSVGNVARDDRHPSLVGQEESLIVTIVWTFVRPLRAVNCHSTTDDVASDEFLAAYESARANGPAASTK